MISFQLKKMMKVSSGMKTILCYGDFNAWGLDYQGRRFPPDLAGHEPEILLAAPRGHRLPGTEAVRKGKEIFV